MRLFRSTIDAMELAKENNSDFFELLDEMVGWEQLMSSRPEIDALGELLKHVSPLGWAHINLTGDYFWSLAGQSRSRPLNLRPERMWA